MTDFLSGKSDYSISLLEHFVEQFKEVGDIGLLATKSMVAVTMPNETRIAWITRLGKDFIHVVFPFENAYPDNLCFEKIAQVPHDDRQFNHHFRMYYKDDVNEEVRGFMKLAINHSAN